MGEVNAALGLAQLSRFDEILQRKQALTDKYREAFRPLGSVRFLEPKYSNDSLPNNWLNAIIVDQGIRDDLLTALHADGILARALPTPLHTLPMYKANPSYNGSMVEADLLWKTLVCLPSGPELV
jgi:perosamine synthetase